MAERLPITKPAWTQLTRVKNLTLDNNLAKGKFFYENEFCYKSDKEKDARAVVTGKLWPTSDLYKNYALGIELQLPSTYPTLPPEVKIEPLIYHPNVDDKGRLCFDKLTQNGGYNPGMSLMQLLEVIIEVIDTPELDKPENPEAAKDYDKKRPVYEQKASEKLKNAEKRKSQ